MKSLSRESEDEGILASINVIPFVDIVLVLLVIFMLTSAAIMRAQIKVELPKAASAGSAIESTINLVYTRSHDLSLNGKKTTFAEAARFIRQQARANPKTQAVISADEGVAYGEVVDVIDLVKKNGVGAFALDVERRKSAPGQ
ncbi:MAG TPA: biopolymer transporter ExbD [Kofleriaceae bacterium]|nr:biopolymer transporter ExbD [Kofleriaceae bacterium]